MTAVDANSVGIQIAEETTLGTLPGSPTWYIQEPNNVTAWGAEIDTKAREPLTRDRMRRAAMVTGLNSKVAFEEDLTYEVLRRRLKGIMYCTPNGPATFVVTGVTATGYTVASGGALPAGYIIAANGFAQTENNGAKLVTSGSTGTEIHASGLVLEAGIAATQNATVQVCGVRASAGDLVIDADGNITSTTLDFTTAAFDLTVGQVIWVGGDSVATQFATAGSGFARIRAIAAGKLTIDSSNLVADAGATKTIELYFGKFYRDVSETHADFVAVPYRFEAAFPDLDAGTDAYGYAVGAQYNMFDVSFPLEDKVTCTSEFLNQDTNAPTTARAAEGANGVEPKITEGFSTTTSYKRLQLMTYAGTVLSRYLKSMTLKTNSNLSMEKVQAQLAGFRINRGGFRVDMDATWVFDDPDQVSAVRDNDKMTYQAAMRTSADGAGFFVDVPCGRLKNGKPSLPPNETVLVDLPMEAEKDISLGYQISWSLFPYLPDVTPA